MGKKGAQALDRNPNWKGGRTVTAVGYVLIKAPSHPAADVRGYVYEHRLVAERVLGRLLRRGEEVHHRDGNRSNNAEDNLEVKASKADHALEHRVRVDLRLPNEPNVSTSCECGCGSIFDRYDAGGRPRRYVSGHNLRSRRISPLTERTLL